MSKQLRLGFPEHVLGFEELCISDSNEAALDVIRDVSRWPSTAVCLLGPAQSGLTTAALAWAKEHRAQIVDPSAFDNFDHAEIETLAKEHSVIDNAEQVRSYENLLSLLNLSRTHERSVLLTSRISPANWPTGGNADLRSRLEAMPIAEFDEPDEVLLRERLVSACRLRYLKLPNNAAEYLAKRMERSFEAIEELASRLDTAISEPGTKLTINTARDVLNEGASTRSLFDDDTG